ncbi:MAG TPA: hypothetical protein PLG56_01730 [Lacunisphaera sp.]|nr:hypothetical protein [Lacunisphaera sp.]
MNAAQRLALIKARFKQPPSIIDKPKGMHAEAHPNHPRQNVRKLCPRIPAKNCFCLSGQFFGGNLFTKRPDWMKSADLVAAEPFKPAFRKQPHALTKIAEKWGSLKRQPVSERPIELQRP